MIYTPANWYWKKSTSEIYSSAAKTTVLDKDENYLQWLALGNSPTPWPKDADGNESDDDLAAVLGAAGVEFNLPNVKVSIPVQVGMDKFRIALIAAAMFDQFDEAIKASAEKRLSVAWEYSTTVFRNGVIVNCLARSLSLTDAQLDQLFSTAAAIQF